MIYKKNKIYSLFLFAFAAAQGSSSSSSYSLCTDQSIGSNEASDYYHAKSPNDCNYHRDEGYWEPIADGIETPYKRWVRQRFCKKHLNHDGYELRQGFALEARQKDNVTLLKNPQNNVVAALFNATQEYGLHNRIIQELNNEHPDAAIYMYVCHTMQDPQLSIEGAKGTLEVLCDSSVMKSSHDSSLNLQAAIDFLYDRRVKSFLDSFSECDVHSKHGHDLKMSIVQNDQSIQKKTYTPRYQTRSYAQRIKDQKQSDDFEDRSGKNKRQRTD